MWVPKQLLVHADIHSMEEEKILQKLFGYQHSKKISFKAALFQKSNSYIPKKERHYSNLWLKRNNNSFYNDYFSKMRQNIRPTNVAQPSK